MPSNHLILCCPLLLLPSIFPSIRVFSNESVLHIRWSKYWSFTFSISPSNEYSGLVSSRIDWFDLLAVQGPLNSLLQLHSSKASILQFYFLYGPTLTQFTISYLRGYIWISDCSQVIHDLENSLNMINRAEFLDALSLIKEKYLQTEVYVLPHFKTT